MRSLNHFPSDGEEDIVRVECWDRMLKRGSSPDSHRLEAEFSCGGTLLDVHRVIVDQYSSDTDDNVDDTGFFFIENVFYVHGDYEKFVNPIISWLNEECSGVPFPRKEFLGIAGDTPSIKPMSSTYLSSIDFCLAVRYVHFCHQTIESIFLFSDIRTNLQNKPKAPKLIDSFTRTYANTVCQGCNHSTASVVCCNDEFTLGESTFMCSHCYWKLHYDEDGNLRYDNFDVYSILDLELVHAAQNVNG